jgi:hypothetical protein
MAGLKNEFSWSKSRDGDFRSCPRKYHYGRYAFWGGWDELADERIRTLYILKNLKNRFAWIGTVVHGCIQRSLQKLHRGEPVLPVEEVIEITLNQMRDDFRASRSGEYRLKPKKVLGLFEHAYRVPLEAASWQKMADAVRTCLRNFYASEVFERFRWLGAKDFLEIEDLAHFQLEGTKIWVTLDCCVREGEGLHIYEWKTGKPAFEANRVQRALYGLYAAGRWGVPLSGIRVHEFNLRANRIETYEVTEGLVSDVQSYIRGSIQDMKRMLQDSEGNVPLPEEVFSFTTDEGTCRWCVFQQVCPHGSELLRKRTTW